MLADLEVSRNSKLKLRTFENTGINITQTAQKHLGAVIREKESCRKFAEDKIKTWTNQIGALSKAAQSELHLSYIVYTRILQNRWKYFKRTFDNMSDLMKPLAEDIRSFVEVFTRRQNISEMDRDITALPIRYGGLGIPNLSQQCRQHFRDSNFLTEKLQEAIISREAFQSDPGRK